MNKFIKLYNSRTTSITGDIFTVIKRNYSEDNDVKDITGNYITAKDRGQANRDFFTANGYTYTSNLLADEGTLSNVKGVGRYPMVFPRQYYLVNDTSGSVDSNFLNELVKGDVVWLVNTVQSGDDGAVLYKLKVLSINCVNCNANTVKLESLDYQDESGSWRSKIETGNLIRTYDVGGTTVTPNSHATSASVAQHDDSYILIDPDTIVSYQVNPDNVAEMIITFKEGTFPKGGYTVIKDLTHTGALNDIIIDSTSYMGDQVDVKIEIDNTTLPETFKWRFGNYIASTTPSNAYAETQRGLSLQFTPLDLGNGEIKVKWLATTGHTTDTWSFTVYPNNKQIYRNQVEELDKIFK